MTFNKQQKQAINSLKGRIRVIAGAGSGKTSVLTERYIKLVESGVKPQNILCVTFTNKAANEMKERIQSKLDKETDFPLICTFHSFCLRILRENAYILGYPHNFAVLDGEDQTSIIKKIYKDCRINYEEISYATAKDIVSERKVNTEEYLLNVFRPDGVITKLYEEAKDKLINGTFRDYKKVVKDCIYFGYLMQEQKLNALDFNDMIILACIIFKQDKYVLRQWQNKIHYIMVDEFQDSSTRQYELVSLLSQKHGNLFVVGDPDQTIYTWRGAKPEILVNFDKDEKTKTIIMNQNYRSTPQILDVANTIISKNTMRVEKDLFTKNKSGPKVEHIHFNSPDEEADWIATKIFELVDTKQYKSKDIAILYRMHFLSRVMEEQCIKKGLQYVVHSGINFYERKEIKDILAYLRVLLNPHDDISLKRIINVPARGIGSKKVEELEKYCDLHKCSFWDALNHFITLDKNTKLQDFVLLMNYFMEQRKSTDLYHLIKIILEKTGYQEILDKSVEEERLLNVDELLRSISARGKNIELDVYLQEISLLTNTDRKDRNRVSLMTVHAAKGLEFKVVFVLGLSEGLFPCYKSFGNTTQEEEERRLAYVAYTRAKERLYLTDNSGKDFNGNKKKTSRFINEIKDEISSNVRELSPFKVFKTWCKETIRTQDDNVTQATLLERYYQTPKGFWLKNKDKNSNKTLGSGRFFAAQKVDKDTYPASYLTGDDSWVTDKPKWGKGQYFDKAGNYYDWDDDTYPQGLVSVEDIFDEGDFC